MQSAAHAREAQAWEIYQGGNPYDAGAAEGGAAGAVREGVAPDRLRNYQKLRRELARDVRRASAR